MLQEIPFTKNLYLTYFYHPTHTLLLVGNNLRSPKIIMLCIYLYTKYSL